MNPVRFLVGLLVLALAVLASSLSNAERAQEYSLKLFSRMVDYVAAQARAGNPVPEIRDIPLASLGLVGPSSSAVVRDVLEGSTATAEGSLLDIPFGDVFALQPSSVRYIASLLDVLSRVDPKFAGQFAPMFGVGSNELGSPENMESVARLVATISSMESSALDMVSRATNTDMADDPLVKSGSLFALSNIVSMATTRVEHVADMFASLARLPAPQLQLFLRDIGWQSNNILKSDDSITAIPNLSYVFPISDELLVHISDAAKAYSSDDGKLARAVQPQIKEYLRQARDFWDFIPGYSTISSVINLSNSPIVSALTDIISLSYKYPNASYWELVLQYYKNIGMPGLNALSSYPSQYVGGLASSVVGGYVSDAISGLVAGILGPDIASATPSSAGASLSSTPTPTQTTKPATSVQSSSMPKPATSTSATKPASASASVSTTAAPLVSAASSSSTSSDGGFWGGIFSIFTTSTNAVAPAAPAPTSVPTSGIKGTISIAPKSTPQPTPAARSKPLEATLDLNANQSTRVTYTLASQPEMLILTVIPRTH